MSVISSIQHQDASASAVCAAACVMSSGVSAYFYGYWFSDGLT